MELPRLYSPVKIKFWSLRNKLGQNMGVIFDCDEIVERLAMRVRTDLGWKWQIKNLQSISEWDWDVITDQESLNESDCEIESWG